MTGQVPMIYRGGLSGTWWCATKWKRLGDGHFEATEKFDVTSQIEEILEDHEARVSPDSDQTDGCSCEPKGQAFHDRGCVLNDGGDGA